MMIKEELSSNKMDVISISLISKDETIYYHLVDFWTRVYLIMRKKKVYNMFYKNLKNENWYENIKANAFQFFFVLA